MDTGKNMRSLEKIKKRYPEKFLPVERVFSHIHRGNRIFVSTGCGEPQYLVSSLMRYVEGHPKALLDAELFHVWTLGVAPCADEKFGLNFRLNSFFNGKNIRERAMDLIAIAHPRFRPWLIEQAKASRLIYKDQTFVPGKKGEYPEDLEAYKTTKTGLRILLRPVKISDEPLLKDLFYSLSDKSIYRRFLSARTDMPHQSLQKFVVIDHSKETVILAVIGREEKEECVGIGQYSVVEATNTGDLAFLVRDDYQNRGIGTELLSCLTVLAKKQGLFGFTVEALVDNSPMHLLLRKMGSSR